MSAIWTVPEPIEITPPDCGHPIFDELAMECVGSAINDYCLVRFPPVRWITGIEASA